MSRPVEVTELSKWFGQKVAVSEVSIGFDAGVTGILGPNGAGKTTLLRLITGLQVPSQGTVRVLGVDPRKDPGVYSKISLVPEDEAVYPTLTCREFVELNASLAGITGRAAVDDALEQVALTGDAGRRLGEFSKGMRQRAKVAAALVSDPEVIVLGGGMSNVGSLYVAVPGLWGRYVFSETVRTRLSPPRHGDSSGARGAAWLWNEPA